MKKTRIMVILFLIVVNIVSAGNNPLFHFDFANTGGKKTIDSTNGEYRCISEDFPMVEQDGALRIAPVANIYITGKLPQLSKELTISLWFVRNSWNTPLLMRGSHSGKIDFLATCKSYFPAFNYKDPQDRGHWEGLFVTGDIPRQMDYANPDWVVSKDFIKIGEWANVQMTFKEGETKIYINGILKCQNTSKCKTLSESSPRIYIGSERLSPTRKIGHVTSNMLINDIRLYSSALTNSELKEIYDSEVSKYSNRAKVVLAPCDSYPPAPGYDPEFKNKLKLTEKYEKEQLPNLDVTIEKGQGNSKLQEMNGAYVLNIGGGLSYPLMYLAPKKSKRSQAIRDFAAAGFKLVGVGTSTDDTWPGQGKYNFKPIDNLVKETLDANPEARIMICSIMRPSAWFIKKHSNEMEKAYIGSRLHLVINGGPFGSDIWEKEMADYYKALICHVESSSYADRVFGYNPLAGQSGEWYWPGGVENMTVGFSEATKKTFRIWLSQKYNNDIDQLRQAWNSSSVTFDNALVPSAEVREKLDYPDFFNTPGVMGAVDDFRHYMGDRTFASMQRLAAIAKNNSERKKLVFIFSGYSISSTLPKLYNSGLFISELAMRCPDIDIIGNLTSYNERRGGQFGGNLNPWSASIYLNGKMPWQEQDLRTHFCMEGVDGRSESVEETTEITKRDLGLSLTKNLGIWWRSFSEDWYHDEMSMNTMAKNQKIATEALNTKRDSLDEVAFIWDEKSLYELNRVKGNFISDHSVSAYRNSFQMGAPASFYFLSDLANPKMPDFKLYIVMNLYRTNDAALELLENKVKRNNAVVAWCFAPGYISDSGRSLENMQKVTGIKLKEFPGRHNLALTISDRNHPISKFAVKSPPYEVAPAFGVDDSKARILGTDGEKAILAVKEMGNWRSVYSLMPLSKELLMGLCDYAGVHVYTRNFDFMSVNRGYLMLHTVSAGKKQISLPFTAEVKELYSDKLISRNAQNFSVDAKEKSTLLFELKH